MSLEAGDRIIETTPTGHVRRWVVAAVGVEPKYRHGYEGRYVALRGDSREEVVMREVDVESVDWMVVQR